MPSKSIREMTALERMRYSLSARLFNSVVVMALVISLASIAFGFYLYTMALDREYKSDTWHLSKTAAGVVDDAKYMQKFVNILEIYAAMSDEERSDADDEAYLAKFADEQDETFKEICIKLRKLQRENDGVSAYVAALDPSANRRIFLVDSDPEDTFCPPGSFDEIDEDHIDAFRSGSKLNFLNRLMRDESVNAVIANLNNYGYRCTAATKILNAAGYDVYVFMGKDMGRITAISRRFLLVYFLILAVITFAAAYFMVRRLKKTVVRPINELADAAAAYSRDKKDEHRDGKHFDKLKIDTGDEIENLWWTMRDMESDLADYIQNLTAVTAEKERINTELNVASQIQEGMVPHIFPVFPERHEFNVYASMNTAKEVGGDFYDIFMIDDDHLVLVMADVSGKGIPAALFMMGSKIMLNNYATMDAATPSAILSRVNDGLCANNSAEMFVTVWLGILEISTGRLTAANAGHEYPAIKRADGSFELLKDKHGFVLGGIEGSKYTDYEIQLKPGDMLFEYTDGVTEATSADKELFGEQRMLDTLNSDADAEPDQVLGNMIGAIDGFVQDADQFDDITMLCLKYRGPKAE